MPQWKLHFGPNFALMRTIFTETVTVYFLIYTRKEPAQARNFIDCASAEDVFVDVTWSVCISIKQFNIEFKVRYEYSSYSSI